MAIFSLIVLKGNQLLPIGNDFVFRFVQILIISNKLTPITALWHLSFRKRSKQTVLINEYKIDLKIIRKVCHTW